jgi:hypothetical protein
MPVYALITSSLSHFFGQETLQMFPEHVPRLARCCAENCLCLLVLLRMPDSIQLRSGPPR